jgi:phosphatidylglycerol:prolipoprotein diacylglycerol transferase
MIDWTPDPIAFHLGPLPVYWYGIGYAVGLFVAYQVIAREVRRRGLSEALFANGLVIVAIAALIGGRAYHVIDQWVLYKDDPLKIVLPPYTGLGVYGGIFLGTVVGVLYARLKGQSAWVWADAVAPGLFGMQAVARWGNFFNQEIYGPPTNLPWGIAIQCGKRVSAYACPPGSDPSATLGQHFQPLFLYESIAGLLGMLFLLWLGRRSVARLRDGDLFLVFLVWYAVVRFLLEFLRAGYNWTLGGIATAQLVSIVAIGGAILVGVIRHRGPRPELRGEPTSTVVAGSAPSDSPDGPPSPAPG